MIPEDNIDHWPPRLQAWYDQLNHKERIEAEYIVNDLKGDFATAYLGIRIMRLEKRSPFRVGVREISVFVAAVLAALGVTKAPIGG